MNPSIKVVGLDPSLNNWGIAQGELDMVTGFLTVSSLQVINPVIPKGKQTKQNSKDLAAAKQLFAGSLQAIQDANMVFVEVPVGSQSARAMASYGICAGVLGALQSMEFPLFEVTPTEVKMAAVGLKTATKAQMIQWATQAHPEAIWPTYKEKGKLLLSGSKAEHMADAIGAIYAGVKSNEFQQYRKLICK